MIIEAALVLPVLLVLILGGIQLAFLVYDAQLLSHATRDAARQAVLFGIDRSAPTSPQPLNWLPLNGGSGTCNADFNDALNLNLIRSCPSINAYVNFFWENRMVSFGGDDDISMSGTDCFNASGANPTAEITGTYDFHFAVPFTGTDLGSVTLRARSRMRCE